MSSSIIDTAIPESLRINTVSSLFPSIWHMKSIPREKQMSYKGIEEITSLLKKYNVDPFRGNIYKIYIYNH